MVDALARISAIDLLFAFIWLGIVALGAWTGVIRQLTVLAALYLGLLLASQLFRLLALGLGLIFVNSSPRVLEPLAYLILVFVAALILFVLSHRAYREARFRGYPQVDQVGGAILGAVNGLLVLVILVMILRFGTDVAWPVAEDVRVALQGSLEASQIPPWLQVSAAPIYWAITPWVPRGQPGFPST